MWFEQNGCYCRRIILLTSIILIIATCSSSSIGERMHRDDRQDNCNGTGNHYQAFCYGVRADMNRRKTEVQRCFNKLYHSYQQNGQNSYLKVEVGHCRCTIKVMSKSKWEETFKTARTSLYQRCCRLSYNVMGYDDSAMSLLAMCT